MKVRNFISVIIACLLVGCRAARDDRDARIAALEKHAVELEVRIWQLERKAEKTGSLAAYAFEMAAEIPGGLRGEPKKTWAVREPDGSWGITSNKPANR